MKPIFLRCAKKDVEFKAVSKKVSVLGINSMNYGLLRGDTFPADTFALLA
jgi:cellobiose-specific phosphotransferase system component IIB